MRASSMLTWPPPPGRWRRTSSAARPGAVSTSTFRYRKSRSRRNVNSMLVWQFDRRKLHRVGGALNYGLRHRALHLGAGGRLVLSLSR